MASLRLKDGAARLVGEAILRALDAQAAAGLGPGKSGEPVTLHGKPGTSEIWETATVGEDGELSFGAPLAFLLAEYGADALGPEALAEVEVELSELDLFELEGE